MPVIRMTESVQPQFRNELVALLAVELNADPTAHRNQEPVVFENPIASTDRFFAVVVWSCWDDIPWGGRTKLILEAYQAADRLEPTRPPRAGQLVTASGLTWDEADANGFFKYAIDAPARAEPVFAAMRDAGGTDTPDGVRLRFLDRRACHAALATLRERLPSAAWQERRVVADEG